MEGAPPEGVNPRAWPTHADRWKWLPDYKLPWAPGTVASYSNVGFDLLADAIETAGGPVLSRTAARAGHCAAWHGGHRLCADTRAVRSAHGRHRPRRRSYVCRYACDRRQRRALQHRRRHGTLAAPQHPRSRRHPDVEPRRLPPASVAAGRDRLRRGRTDGRPRSRLGHHCERWHSSDCWWRRAVAARAS